MYSIYSLFGLLPGATAIEILEKCKQRCEEWTLAPIIETLIESKSTPMTRAEATVNAQKIYNEGDIYLKSSAAVLLDPSARQCYDAFLDAMGPSGTEPKKKLTRSRLLWFNNNSKDIQFSKNMIDMIQIGSTEPPKKKQKLTITSKPQCRQCRGTFDFNKPYLVLHCHCTTRVGHKECLETFSKRVKDKCPVCRQQLLKRQQVSKYLFWNVKEKYRFIT
jgi:hypothetical protein